MTVDVVNQQNEKVGSFDLRDEVFGGRVKVDLIHESVVRANAAERRGTHATKTRAMVSGSGKKPWRQKGTGRARHGSIRSPIWVGGGTVFGPQPREYSYQIPRKMRALAIRSVLADRARDGKVVVVDEFNLDAPQTKTVAALLKQLGLADSRVLIVSGGPDQNLFRSVRNIRGAQVLPHGQLNVYDLLASDVLVLTKSGLEGMKERSA